MAEGKRYYWLKLRNDFFKSKRIKKLRKIAGGNTYVIIYLEMQLLSLQTEGVLTFSGLESSFAEELALDLDESPIDVQATLSYMLRYGLAETDATESELFMPYVIENTGSEGASAKRVREFREREKLKELPCVTSSLQCNAQALPSNFSVTERQRQIQETEKRDRDRHTADVPTVEDIERFCKEQKLSAVNPKDFFECYEACDWMIKGKPIQNWKGVCVRWNKKGGKPNGNNRSDGETVSGYRGTVL